MTLKQAKNTTKLIISILLAVSISGCSAIMADKDKQLLPDSGATTAEIIEGTPQAESYYGNGQKAPYIGEAIAPFFQSSSRYSNAHLAELRGDFQRVPNPEIIGYVYPHLNNNDMPIPGYFTAFLLYERQHYALAAEGHHE